MDIELYRCYKAKVNYHRTDDLKEGTLSNGDVVNVQALWIADKGEKFEGEVIFMPSINDYWLPQRDLIILEEIDTHLYCNERNDYFVEKVK